MGYKPGKDSPIVPLLLNMECCEVPEKVSRNISLTLDKQYTRFNEFIGSESGTVSVCGFGPSFKYTYKDIQGDVFACNGAHDFLIDKGIVPKWCMLWDADPIISKFVTPHKDVTYLVASRCHESVFEVLKDSKVIVWHPLGDQMILELLEARNIMEPTVHGGSAAVTRALIVAKVLGYTDIHLHGCDSSYEDLTHVNKSLVEEQELKIFANGKWFKSTPWLAGQVEDFKILAPPLKAQGINIVVHGTGLLPHIAEVMGYEVITSTT